MESLLGTRGALPAWPDPLDSLGQRINTRTRRIRRRLVWFPRGPALQRYNETIRPEVESILNNIELPEGENLIVKLYMIGRSEQNVNPIIMICCTDKKTRKNAEDMIRESGLLRRGGNSGFGLGSTGFPLECSFLPRPLGKGIYLDIDPTAEAALKVDVYGLTEPGIGRKLSFVTSSQTGWSVQNATGGPIVQLGDHLYQLTVAHATKPNPGSKAPRDQSSDTDDCEFDGQSDEGEEDDDDEHIILSRGSVSPGWQLRDNDTDSDHQRSQPSSAYSDSWPQSPDTRRSQSRKMSTPVMSPRLLETAEEHDEWKSSTLLGSFPVPDGYGTELDYLLIKLPEETSSLVKGLNEVILDEPFRSRRVLVQDIGSTNNEAVSILAVTSRGAIRGNILADAVSLKTRKSCAFQQLLTVMLSSGLREGDSGSALIDAQTGHFYGYVILGVDGDCVAYALPSPMIMAKITTQFRHLPSFQLASEHRPSSSQPAARYQPAAAPMRHAWPSSSTSAMPTIPEHSAQSSNYMVPLSDHVLLQGDLLDARREVQRLNTELRNRRSELEGSRGELLDPALVRDMQAAISDESFQEQLRSLEGWFYVVSPGQQSVALHTLLQNANPAHVDYIRHILRRRGAITPLSELIATDTTAPDISPFVTGSSHQDEDDGPSMDTSG